jgi:hypothetical protein
MRSEIRIIALALASALAGCSSAHSDANTKGPFSGGFSVELRSFLDGPITSNGPQEVPSYLYVSGQIYDGPYPGSFLETALPAPSDATPGCAVYSVAPPRCSNIGGCGAKSQDSECAAAADSSNPCVCVDTDVCQRFPNKVSAGDVTVTGVADSKGNTSLHLKNLANSYQIPDGTTLGYPGFAEGDRIDITATGGDTPHFELSAKGVAPLSFTREAYELNKDPTSDSPTQYQAFEIEWDAPTAEIDTEVHLEFDISHHGGTVGYLACEVQDTGSLTVSSGLISQLIELGGIGGFPELSVERTTTSSVEVGESELELEVTSAKEFILKIDGYASCLSDSDCGDGQACNRTIKLCQAP